MDDRENWQRRLKSASDRSGHLRWSTTPTQTQNRSTLTIARFECWYWAQDEAEVVPVYVQGENKAPNCSNSRRGSTDRCREGLPHTRVSRFHDYWPLVYNEQRLSLQVRFEKMHSFAFLALFLVHWATKLLRLVCFTSSEAIASEIAMFEFWYGTKFEIDVSNSKWALLGSHVFGRIFWPKRNSKVDAW